MLSGIRTVHRDDVQSPPEHIWDPIKPIYVKFAINCLVYRAFSTLKMDLSNRCCNNIGTEDEFDVLIVKTGQVHLS